MTIKQSEFTILNEALQKHVGDLLLQGAVLFRAKTEDDINLWEEYLKAFPEGTNPVMRERTEHDCSCCRDFFRQIGKTVLVKRDGEIVSIWDFELEDETYGEVVKQLKTFKMVPMYPARFISKKIGVFQNHEFLQETGEVIKWNHFYLELPENYCLHADDLGTHKSNFLSSLTVLKSGLQAWYGTGAIETVLELIDSEALYRADSLKEGLLLDFKKLMEDICESGEINVGKMMYYAHKYHASVTRLRNTTLGELVTKIAEGKNLEVAVREYEAMVAPENYQRSKPIFTKKMLEDAFNKLEELGLKKSLSRQHASMLDVNPSNSLYVDRKPNNLESEEDLFGSLLKETKNKKKDFSRLPRVKMKEFLESILPKAESLNVYLEHKLTNNFASITKAYDEDAPSLFKWDNQYAWAFNGGLADSSMRENVKKAGGKVDGDIRFSIQWNDSGMDNSDLDAHCVEKFENTVKRKNEIYFGEKFSRLSQGKLDVDIINPNGKVAVENITWDSVSSMPDGKYEMIVHQYSEDRSEGFSAEIEILGEIFQYQYQKPMRDNEKVLVGTITIKNGVPTLQNHLSSTSDSKMIWNLNSNNFHKVQAVLPSPTKWGEELTEELGGHIFFILEDCQNPDTVEGFYNEFLKTDLRPHRKVFEALSSKTRVAFSEQQLSGLGFSLTQKKEVVIKAVVEGAEKLFILEI